MVWPFNTFHLLSLKKKKNYRLPVKQQRAEVHSTESNHAMINILICLPYRKQGWQQSLWIYQIHALSSLDFLKEGREWDGIGMVIITGYVIRQSNPLLPTSCTFHNPYSNDALTQKQQCEDQRVPLTLLSTLPPFVMSCRVFGRIWKGRDCNLKDHWFG